MFERFTESARQAVVLAEHEARDLRHNYIGSEHVLLGLAGDPDTAAGRVLAELDVGNVEILRANFWVSVGQGGDICSEQIPFTPRAKRVLERSLREGLSLQHNYIGTEHILLA